MRRNGRCTGIGALSLVLLVAGLSATPLRAHHFGGGAASGGETDLGTPDPGCDEEGEPPTAAGDPVSPFTGKWFYRHVDLDVPGVLPIRLVRRYDSQTTYDSPLGAGWAFTYDTRLFEDPDGDVIVRNACGQIHHYGGGIGAPDTESPGWRQTLSGDGSSGFILTDPRGTKRFFNTDGSMTRIEDPQGNALEFHYSTMKVPLTGTSRFAVEPATPLTVAKQFQLLRIDERPKGSTCVGGETPANGGCRHIQFAFGTDGRLDSATTHDGRQVTYDHELQDVGGQPLTTGNLSQVMLVTGAGPSGIVQTFGYEDSAHPHAVTSFGDGQGMRVVKNAYDAEGRVIRQELAGSPDATVFEFNYNPTQADFLHSADFEVPNDCASVRCTLVTRTVRDPGDVVLATEVTTYKYRADGFPLEVIDAEAHQRVFSYITGRPFLDTLEVLEFQGVDGSQNPIRQRQKLIYLNFDAAGNLTSRAVSVATAAGGSELITETWSYDQGWVDQYQIVSDGHPTEPFVTSFTFWRNGLNPGDASYVITDPPENIYEIKRRHFDLTEEITKLAYNAHGRLERVTLPDGHEVKWSYYSDTVGGVIRDGLVSQVAHQLTSGGDDPDPHLRTNFDYDAQGRVNEVTDARVHATQLGWDLRGRMTQVENPLGERTILTYGGPTAATATGPGRFLVQLEVGQVGVAPAIMAGEITKFVYDDRGNLEQVQRLVSGATPTTFATFTSDSAGRRRTADDAVGRTLTFGYDLLGRQTSVTDDANHATVSEYDATGNRTKVTDATDFDRVFQYDALDRLIQVTEVAIDGSDDAVTQFAYDAVGNVTAINDPRDHATIYTYNALSQLERVTRPEGGQVNYHYDLRGRLQRLINARGNVLDYEYDPWGPLASVEHYVNETEADVPTNVQRTIEYTYDNSGNLLTATDDAIQSGALYAAVSPGVGDPYDELNRLRKLDIALPGVGVKSLEYAYDRFGNRESLVFTDGAETLVHTFIYDDPAEDLLNRLKTAALPGMGVGDAYAFGYLGNDDLETITRPSGVATGLS